MALRDKTKYKLSKCVLEMKFMKKSKEKAEKEQEAEDSRAIFSDAITEGMKHGGDPPWLRQQPLTAGYHGSNPGHSM
ncbi:uncharacterized protein Mpp6 isoform X3 [Anabrus simplex]|uniref:uncharacterized protein Mpp6 isoform X3 n=1 Tax=Anabrus simplex TaxID=316456 RepID=UPI0035A2DF27